MKATVKFKSNRPVVIKQGQDAAEVIGKRMGAYVMTTARRSLKRKTKDGKPSPAGSPPKASPQFKANVRFEWDKASRSVVIGPRKLTGVATADAIEALELGKITSRLIPINRREKRRVRAQYPSRAFMVPAMEKRLGELPGLWKGAIRG